MMSEGHAAAAMPQYECHKKVWALKIAAVEQFEEADTFRLVFEDELFAPRTVTGDWLRQKGAKVGGYLVQYEDGYMSWSPSTAFEGGYSLIEMVPMDDEAAEAIARVCHEANRAYCTATGDNSQPPWDEAPEWQRESAKNGVRSHAIRPRSPRESHELWLEEKREAGWSYGPVKDPENLEHPCFVEYDELPLEQRLKDSLFSSICRVMMGRSH